LANDSNAPKSNVAGTSQHNTMPPESSAVLTPQFGMPLNYFEDRLHKPVRPIMED
jgi:hypothetical protein